MFKIFLYAVLKVQASGNPVLFFIAVKKSLHMQALFVLQKIRPICHVTYTFGAFVQIWI